MRIQHLICTSPQICAHVEQKTRNEQQVKSRVSHPPLEREAFHIIETALTIEEVAPPCVIKFQLTECREAIWPHQ